MSIEWQVPGDMTTPGNRLIVVTLNFAVLGLCATLLAIVLALIGFNEKISILIPTFLWGLIWLAGIIEMLRHEYFWVLKKRKQRLGSIIIRFLKLFYLFFVAFPIYILLIALFILITSSFFEIVDLDFLFNLFITYNYGFFFLFFALVLAIFVEYVDVIFAKKTSVKKPKTHNKVKNKIKESKVIKQKGKKGKSWYKKWWAISLFIFFGLIIFLGILGAILESLENKRHILMIDGIDYSNIEPLNCASVENALYSSLEQNISCVQFEEVACDCILVDLDNPYSFLVYDFDVENEKYGVKLKCFDELHALDGGENCFIKENEYKIKSIIENASSSDRNYMRSNIFSLIHSLVIDKAGSYTRSEREKEWGRFKDFYYRAEFVFIRKNVTDSSVFVDLETNRVGQRKFCLIYVNKISDFENHSRGDIVVIDAKLTDYTRQKYTIHDVIDFYQQGGELIDYHIEEYKLILEDGIYLGTNLSEVPILTRDSIINKGVTNKNYDVCSQLSDETDIYVCIYGIASKLADEYMCKALPDNYNNGCLRDMTI